MKKNRHILSTQFILFIFLASSLLVSSMAIQTVDGADNIIWRKWTKTGTPGGGEGLVIGDVNRDGVQEIIYAGSNRAVALRGTDGSYCWDVPVDGAVDTTQPQMADLDGDSYLEVVVPILKTPAAGFYILDGRDGSIEQKIITAGRTDGSPVIADIDGDGYPVIFFASMTFVEITDDSNSTGWLRSYKYNFGSTPRYKELYRTRVWHPCAGGLSIADADHDGEFELYMGDRDMYYQYDRGYGGGVVSFWARNLTERWRHPDLLVSSHIPVLADVNKDGMLEVIATPQRGGIVVLNSKDGSPVKKTLKITSNGKPVSGHYQSSVYDIDHDGNLEILMADGSHDITWDVVIWDLVAWKEDARIPSSLFGQSYYGPQVGDVSGDGIMDILVVGYTGLYIFDGAHNPSTDGTYPLLDSETGLVRRLMYAVVQDIDNDHLAEVVVPSQGGVIYAFDTPSPAPNPRPRTEVQFNSERRLGTAEYIAPLRETEQPIVFNAYPANEAMMIPVSTAELSFSLIDYQNNKMIYSVTTSPNIGWKTESEASNGRYTVGISGLVYSKTYKWFVKVTDGITWTNMTYWFVTSYAPIINNAPTQQTPLLVSSDGSNSPSANLIAYNQTTTDADRNSVTNTYHWYTNGVSVTNLLMPFNARSSLNVKDYSGYGNNGVIRGNVTWTNSGAVGGAYVFNQGSIVVPDSNVLDGNYQWYEMSVELWVCLTASQSGTRLVFKQTSYQIGFQTSGTSNVLYAGIWTLKQNPDTTAHYFVQSYIEASYATPLSLNKWYHVAFTYKKGVGVKLFVNGLLVATKSQSANDFGYVQRSMQPLYLGSFSYFRGKMDEICIFPRSLSSQQIYQDYLQSRNGWSNISTTTSAELKSGQTWKCEIIPTDSFTDGTSKISNIVSLSTSNTAPVASSLNISPTWHHRAHDSVNLLGSYKYYDANGDPESGTQIRWYKNGILQPVLNDQLSVPSNLTIVGDTWYFTVKPEDGKDFGTLQKSYSVKIIS